MTLETWRWIWLGAVVLFTLGEMVAPGSFFLLPFAVGAAAATAGAFLGLPLGLQWLAFVVVSAVAFGLLRSVGRRLDLAHSGGTFGAQRLVGQSALVVREIPGGPAAVGTIRLGGEEWRAESMFSAPIRTGSTVKVMRIDGTRAVVVLLEEPAIDGTQT